MLLRVIKYHEVTVFRSCELSGSHSGAFPDKWSEAVFSASARERHAPITLFSFQIELWKTAAKMAAILQH